MLKINGVPAASKWGLALTLLALGLSAGAALAHRFVSTDSMACHISLLRMRLRSRTESDVENETASRNRMLKLSGRLLLLSGLLLGVGALALAASFIFLLQNIPRACFGPT